MKKSILFLFCTLPLFGATPTQGPLYVDSTGKIFSPVTAAQFYASNPPSGGVTSFNTRTGAVTLTNADVNALTSLALITPNIGDATGTSLTLTGEISAGNVSFDGDTFTSDGMGGVQLVSLTSTTNTFALNADSSGYVAGNNISWDPSGDLTVVQLLGHAGSGIDASGNITGTTYNGNTITTGTGTLTLGTTTVDFSAGLDSSVETAAANVVNTSGGFLTVGGGVYGTVTSITAGTGLTGGTITSTGTITVSYGTTSGTAAQGNDSRIVNALAYPTMTLNTSSTITFNTSGNSETIYDTSASTQTSATITLPATGNTKAGQLLTYVSNGIITTLTITGGTQDVGPTLPTTLAANTVLQFQENGTTGHYVRIR